MKRGIAVWLLAACLVVAAARNAVGSELSDDTARSATLAAKAAERYEAGDLFGALRGYQRALFWARRPDEPTIKTADQTPPAWWGEIVPLAMSLNRFDDAIRYAVLLPESVVDDPQTLQRLALHARQQRQWRDAIRLQQRWLASRRGSANGFEALLTHLEIGRMQFLIDDMPAASESFERVQRAFLTRTFSRTSRVRLESALGGSMTTTWSVFGQAHLNAGRRRLAAEAFNRLATTPDGAARASYWLARMALDAGRPLRAYELLQERQQANPPNDDGLAMAPYALLRRVYRQLNQPAAALDDLRLIADERPNDLWAGLALGEMLSNAEKQREAESMFAAVARRAFDTSRVDPLVLALDPDAAPEPDYAAIATASVWLLTRYASIDQQDAFLALAGDLHGVFDGLGEFREDLAVAFNEHPEFARGVTERLEATVTSLTPMAVAELHVAGGRYAAANRAFQSAVEQAPAGDARQRAALEWWRTLMLDEQYADAAGALEWAVGRAIWPADDGTPYFHRAAALVLDDQPTAAVQAALKAAEIKPDEPTFVDRVGWALLRAERKEEAVACYTKMLEQFDEETDELTRDLLRGARMSLSHLTDLQGDAAAAVEWALAALDEFPDNAGVLNDLAYLWAKRGEHAARAVRMAQRAVELEPDNAAYVDTLGWAQHKQGRSADALESIEHALELVRTAGDPPDAEILDHYGDLLSKLGRVDEAHQAWREAIDAYKQKNDAEAAATVQAKF